MYLCMYISVKMITCVMYIHTACYLNCMIFSFHSIVSQRTFYFSAIFSRNFVVQFISNMVRLWHQHNTYNDTTSRKPSFKREIFFSHSVVDGAAGVVVVAVLFVCLW